MWSRGAGVGLRVLKAERKDSTDYLIIENSDETHNMRVSRSRSPFNFSVTANLLFGQCAFIQPRCEQFAKNVQKYKYHYLQNCCSSKL